ncbi:uncharacterized protein CCOS01_09663, partial [Colletotrichum costaricense]
AIHHSSGPHPSDFVFLLSAVPLFTFLCTLNTLNNRSTAGQAVQVPVSATARATASLSLGDLPATHHPPTLQMSVPHPSTSCTLARYRYVSHLPPSRRLRMRSPPFASARKTSTVEGFQVVSGPGVCCHGSAQVESSRVESNNHAALHSCPSIYSLPILDIDPTLKRHASPTLLSWKCLYFSVPLTGFHLGFITISSLTRLHLVPI